jgi:hypothetical protein
MFLHFYFVNIKKEKKNYIMVYKSDEESITFKDINNLLYHQLNNLSCITSTLESSLDLNNSINYHELFYIKQGLSIPYTKSIWNDLIKIYLNKMELQYLIDDKYIINLYSYNIVLFLMDDYQKDIKQFLINYYGKFYN